MFEMLRKLLMALNSSQQSWQVSLAIALGMVPGLTPVMSLHNLLFILLAFFLNVHLGLFFISMALFAGIAWLADPAMESLGYWLLTHPALEALWTGLYNNPFWLLSNFNNTLVLGSLVLGLLLLIPVYLLSDRFIWAYRGPFSRLTRRIPLVKKLLAFDEEKAAKAKKPARVRWIGLGVFGVLFGGSIAFGMLLLDPLLKGALQDQLSKSAGAEADVATLTTKLSPLSIEITGIALPDRDDTHTNAVEVDRLAFDLDLGHLFHKRAIIDRLSAEGIRLGVPRSTPARKLPIQPPEPEPLASEPGMGQKAAMALGDRLPEPKAVLDQETLASQSEGERIRKELEAIEQKWEQITAQEFSQSGYADLQTRYRELRKRAETIRSPEELREILREAQALKSDAKARIDTYRQRIKEFEADQRRSRELLAEIRALPGEDFRALKEKYSFDSEGAFNLAGALLGEDVTGTITQLRSWYAKALPFIRTAKEINQRRKGPQIESPPRGEGRIIAFESFDPVPGFLLREAGFDITTESGSRLAGQLTGATSDQRVTGEPVRLALLSTKPVGYETLELLWVGDSRQSDRLDQITLSVQGYEQGEKRADRLRMADTKLDFDLALSLTKARHLEGEGRMVFAPVKLSLADPGGELERIVARTLSGVERFNVDLHIGGRVSSPKIKLDTDLDRQLERRFKAELDARIKAFEAELKAAIADRAREELAKAGASTEEIALIESALKGEMSTIEAIEKRTNQELSQKALEAKLQEHLDAEKARLKQEAQERIDRERREAEEKLQRRQDEERKKLEDEARDRLRRLL